MIPGITIAAITTASALGLLGPISLWWKSRRWRSLGEGEEVRAEHLLNELDQYDEFSQEFNVDLQAIDFVLNHVGQGIGNDPLASSSVVLYDRGNEGFPVGDTIGSGLFVTKTGALPLVKKVYKRLTDHNHMKLAKKLSDRCRMHLSVGDYTEANKLVVLQWLKNELKQVPNRRDDHCLKVVSLALVMVFTPTSAEVETSALMNSRAIMRRRFEYEQTKISRLGGFYGWFTGYRRVEEPSTVS